MQDHRSNGKASTAFLRHRTAMVVAQWNYGTPVSSTIEAKATICDMACNYKEALRSTP